MLIPHLQLSTFFYDKSDSKSRQKIKHQSYNVHIRDIRREISNNEEKLTQPKK